MTDPSMMYPATRTPPPPGEESAGPSLVTLTQELRDTTAELRRSFLMLRREWTRYIAKGNATASGNTATVNIEPVPGGFEVEIERVSISLSLASAAATAVVYSGGAGEGNIEDVISAFVGNTPSRVVRVYTPPIRLLGNEKLVVVVSSTAGQDGVYVRVEGRKREP